MSNLSKTLYAVGRAIYRTLEVAQPTRSIIYIYAYQRSQPGTHFASWKLEI